MEVPEETAHDVLEQTYCLLVDERLHHVAEDGADGVEALVRLTDVVESHVVEEDLLHDEDGDGFGKLAARLHDAEA